MIPREWIDWLRIFHGVFNTTIASILMYQGWMGWKIRQERMAGSSRDFRMVRRHRTLGPVLVILGLAGYCSGLLLAYLDDGHIFRFPIHNLTGSLIGAMLITTYVLSRNIKGLASPWRTPHLIVGIIILCVYLIQIYLGLNILL